MAITTNVQKFQKIYITDWRGGVSGGSETFHQICHILRTVYGSDAYMAYTPFDFGSEDQLPPERFRGYNVKVASSIEDTENNLLLINEGLAPMFDYAQFRSISVCFVWLSYDFVSEKLIYYHDVTAGASHPRLEWCLHYLHRLLVHPRSTLFRRYCAVPWDRFRGHPNVCNCYYAWEKMKRHGVNAPIGRLIGPINHMFVSEQAKALSAHKENYVCFGVAKDKRFWSLVVKKYYDLFGEGSVKFVPMKGMTREEMVAALARAKVYFDFGYFPGPERIPREAVLLNCNIITGKRGAAKNQYDVPIPSKYKFAMTRRSLTKIAKAIHELLCNYAFHMPEFDRYRTLAKAQMEAFQKDVGQIYTGTFSEYQPL